ncbi:phytanoyl-CoA dioxygenase family protein [Jannaschia sp. M317]|uniref:phytanoyl-CoA dioxygenase family protein n=1 Tax=Jannaschia sp. M317 TaxID=2867011 RepID=UPI0021A695A3|nr:phytanoyl-CoA dioxygenase family protein [Jannaschia sp. M317]UWQ18072.1 phytanoyl-CoA dioxygenase family protein [Jannaschia sp. M317]
MSEISEFFIKHGYWHAKGVFDPEHVAGLETDFDRIVTQLATSGEAVDATWGGSETAKLASDGDRILHTHNVQQYSRRWMDALLDDRLLDVIEELVGADIVLHHSKLFQKPSEKGSPFPMHQDWPYFPTLRDSMVAGIIHVSDATNEMGCLRVWPGSHRLGRIAGADGRSQNDVIDAHPIEDALPVEAKAGDVVFFHYFTLHGSMPNRSDRVRKTVLCQFYAGNDRVEDGNTHPDERLVLRGWNHHASRERANV